MNKLITLLIIGILFLNACGNDNDKADAYGNFEAKDYIISSEIPGKILKLEFSEGQTVKKNENIGLIDTNDLFLKKKVILAQKNALSSKFSDITAQIAVLNTQKQVINKEYKRILNLLTDSAATQKQADDITGKIQIIDKQITQVKNQNNNLFDQLKVFDSQIESIDSQIKKCKIINPVSGSVLTKYTEENEITMPGKPLYKIADLSEMKLRAYISGNQLSKIKIGQKVKVFIDTEEDKMKEYEGIVSQISNEAEFTPKIIQTKEERVNLVYAIIVKVINDGSIKIGMPGEMRF